jgi:hypothetical protein
MPISVLPSSHPKITALSDENLFRQCRLYGANAKFWRQKFLGLLPEVQRRRLYESKGFTSIFEFAKKLAGVSEEQVRLVLNLERKFQRTPLLQTLLVSGEVSPNKLVRIASIATVENQEALAAQAKILSKSALETLVRDEKRAGAEDAVDRKSAGANGSQKPLFNDKSLPGQTSNSINQDLELLQKLPAELKTRLHQMARKGIDIGQLLTELLNQHEQNIETRKAELGEQAKMAELESKRRPSRYISVAVKKVLQQEYGTKCAIQTCQMPASQIHHTQRFALHSTHDPRLLAPLCAEHHQIAHAVDAKYWQRRSR